MAKVICFLLASLTLQADLYDRNRYGADFPKEKQVRVPEEMEPDCPCDPGDLECPCQVGPEGDYHRVP